MLSFLSNEQTFQVFANLHITVNSAIDVSVNYMTDTFTEIFELICQLASDGGVLSSIVSEVEGMYTICTDLCFV